MRCYLFGKKTVIEVKCSTCILNMVEFTGYVQCLSLNDFKRFKTFFLTNDKIYLTLFRLNELDNCKNSWKKAGTEFILFEWTKS